MHFVTMLVRIELQGLFASFIPEIGEILADKRVYSGDYEIQYGRRYVGILLFFPLLYVLLYFAFFHFHRHVVVCGHLTLRGIKAFLKDMLHPDRDEREKNICVIFLGQ